MSSSVGLERPHWSLDRRINIGHIFTTVSALALIVTWGVSVETRLAEQTVHLQSASQWAKETSRQLNELNQKVEKLIELTAYQKGLSDGQQGRLNGPSR